jgi:hypothetical protein
MEEDDGGVSPPRAGRGGGFGGFPGNDDDAGL